MTADPSQRSDGQVLPYIEMTDDTYAELAAQRFTLEEPGHGTMMLRGPCPRCHAVIEVPVVESIFRSTRGIGFGRRSPGRGESTHVEPMMCTCEDEHPRRPEGEIGCGAFWVLTVSAPAR
jgi:hypothetical protein